MAASYVDNMSHKKLLEESSLARFREVQRLAYDCAIEVGATLSPGITERQAAGRLKQALLARGVDDWLHTPFAWFGDRTAFRGFRSPLAFFPSDRVLAEGMPWILDCAPIRDGYSADIGYAGSLGHNPVFELMMRDLEAYRSLIVDQVSSGATLRDTYLAVDALITRQGYDNRHQVYPGRVIAHQVTRVRSVLPSKVVAGFGIRFLQTLGRDLGYERLHGRSPLWADGKSSDHRPVPGLWAVEPHLGFRDVGVKFEEILVVTEDGAHWLDDDVPHVRRWASALAAR
jgi:Xaa-Pro aminopeptidase